MLHSRVAPVQHLNVPEHHRTLQALIAAIVAARVTCSAGEAGQIQLIEDGAVLLFISILQGSLSKSLKERRDL